MNPVDPAVYRAALDRVDTFKKATMDARDTFAELERALRVLQRPTLAAACALAKDDMDSALETVRNADAWDNATLDADGKPIPPPDRGLDRGAT